MTLSSWSTIPLEEVAAAAPGGYRWFQLYVYKVCLVLQLIAYHLLSITHQSAGNVKNFFTRHVFQISFICETWNADCIEMPYIPLFNDFIFFYVT